MAILEWKVNILGVDVSEDVEYIETLQQRLDVPALTEYAVSDVSLYLMPNQFDYAPEKRFNFFTRNGGQQTGYHAPITIEAGERGGPLQTLFSGILVTLTQDVAGQGFQVIATDNSVLLRNHTISDFGLPKNSTLRQLTDATNPRGDWAFSDAVSPVSPGSVSGTLGGVNLVDTQNFGTEGILSPFNFQLAEEGTRIETERLPDDAEDALNVTYKAPFRGIGIERVIDALLTNAGIPNTPAKLPFMRASTPHWAFLSRPGYETEFAAPGPHPTAFGWNGYVTDYVRNPANGDIFCLYSHRGTTILPQLLTWTAATDTWSIVYQHGSHAEWWQLATADFEDFFILQTTGIYEQGVPRRGTYNAAEGSTRTSILKLGDGGQTSVSTFVGSGSRRPQLAVHYWYGFIQGTGKLRANNARFGFLPDTRTGLHIAENALWYRYANATQFGLARLRTSNGQGETVIVINRDEYANEASFDFTLDVPNRTIYGSHTTIGRQGNTTRSRHLVYSRAMPTSY